MAVNKDEALHVFPEAGITQRTVISVVDRPQHTHRGGTDMQTDIRRPGTI